MKETGVRPSLEEAAILFARSGHEGAVVSTANRVMKETGVRPSLEDAAILFARSGGKSGHKASVVSTANRVENETGRRPSDEEAATLLAGMGGAATLGKRKKNDSEWYVLVPFPPLKTESRCGDTKQKIAAQLVTDGIGYQFGSLAKDYMNRWCKTASRNDAKSVLIERLGKKWQLSIVKKKPENIQEVDMQMYADVSNAYRSRKRKV
jgi:hypothetical protein